MFLTGLLRAGEQTKPHGLQHEQPSTAKDLPGTVSHQPPKALGPKQTKCCPDTPTPGEELQQGHRKATSVWERVPGRSRSSRAEEELR